MRDGPIHGPSSFKASFCRLKNQTINTLTIYENNYLLEHDGDESLLNTTSYEFYANKTINYYNWTLQNYGHL